jgi:hypothetical protein
MTDKTKDRRRGQYKGLNCGGTTDWAIDLQGVSVYTTKERPLLITIHCRKDVVPTPGTRST